MDIYGWIVGGRLGALVLTALIVTCIRRRRITTLQGADMDTGGAQYQEEVFWHLPSMVNLSIKHTGYLRYSFEFELARGTNGSVFSEYRQ